MNIEPLSHRSSPLYPMLAAVAAATMLTSCEMSQHAVDSVPGPHSEKELQLPKANAAATEGTQRGENRQSAETAGAEPDEDPQALGGDVLMTLNGKDE